MDLYEYLMLCKVKNRKFTYATFAKKLGIKPITLGRIVNGHARPSFDIAYKIEKLSEGKVNGWELLLSFTKDEK